MKKSFKLLENEFLVDAKDIIEKLEEIKQKENSPEIEVIDLEELFHEGKVKKELPIELEKKLEELRKEYKHRLEMHQKALEKAQKRLNRAKSIIEKNVSVLNNREHTSIVYKAARLENSRIISLIRYYPNAIKELKRRIPMIEGRCNYFNSIDIENGGIEKLKLLINERKEELDKIKKIQEKKSKNKEMSIEQKEIEKGKKILKEISRDYKNTHYSYNGEIPYVIINNIDEEKKDRFSGVKTKIKDIYSIGTKKIKERVEGFKNRDKEDRFSGVKSKIKDIYSICTEKIKERVEGFKNREKKERFTGVKSKIKDIYDISIIKVKSKFIKEKNRNEENRKEKFVSKINGKIFKERIKYSIGKQVNKKNKNEKITIYNVIEKMQDALDRKKEEEGR